MTEPKEVLQSLVNASGFLFQLRIEQEIRATGPNKLGNWEFAAREHRWLDTHDGSEGFIDLILKSGPGRMVIECKRVTDANWVFLIPDTRNNMTRAQILWTMRTNSTESIADWHDFQIRPSSPEATFCIVRGQGEKDTPMLERLSSQVLQSLESFANEEIGYTDRSARDAHIYFPVIVTNATLYTCQFDPSLVDISTGQLAQANFQEVPCVRFRKSFSSGLPSRQPNRDIEKTNYNNERTVFVVNSVALTSVLADWNIPYNESNAPWPWESFR